MRDLAINRRTISYNKNVIEIDSVEKNINFFLRRQDPFHNFGMFVKKDGIQINNKFEVPTIEYDYSGVEHIFEI